MHDSWLLSVDGSQDARGDQCDACGNLLNPTELINPRCKITGTKPVLRSTRHIFLDLPKLSPALQVGRQRPRGPRAPMQRAHMQVCVCGAPQPKACLCAAWKQSSACVRACVRTRARACEQAVR